jgi:hypothetical protein
MLYPSAGDQHLSRRGWLKGAAAAAIAPNLPFADGDKKLPPVRTITKGPKFHWFGYYDKWQFDPTNRYVLGMEVDFEHRSPKPEDRIRLGVVDLHDKDKWTELGTSTAWSWQQGCMLQWIPGTKDGILWNDIGKDRFVCRIMDGRGMETRTIDRAVYTLDPTGKWAVTVDFARLNDVRPGYGYAGVIDPHRNELRPRDSGIWRVNLQTGKSELLFAIADVAAFGPPLNDMKDAKHWFNHLLYSPDGSRFIFLHRWRPKGTAGFRTRMFTASAEGKDLFLLDPSGSTSHFVWRDPRHILAWTKPEGKDAGFWLFKDKSTELEQVGKGVMTENGHCTYLPGGEWILNDTYPDKERVQHPYLFHAKTGRKVALGHFLSPKEYTGEWRCDTHPRFSRDGKLVCIDSPHVGPGRQMHVIDVGGIASG